MSASTVVGTVAAALVAFTEELAAAGVRDVVVCPGSRSTPMALAIAAHPGLRVIVDLDERGAGFLAVGLARAGRRPVAVLVTSGTAAANLLPAVVESHEGRVPLLVLTADRPIELRDRGAPQTIDQLRLFGRFVRWDAELPVPSAHPVSVAHVRHVVARAVAMATGSPAGPVHLDLPYREPLVPDGSLVPTPRTAPYTRVLAGLVPDPGVIADVARRVAMAERPLIWCGPIDQPGFAGAVTRLAARLRAPLLADGLANLRSGPHDRSQVIARSSVILRSPAFTSGHQPDLVIRFGGTPTARTTMEWLGSLAADQLVVDDGGWNEPTFHPTTLVHAQPVTFAEMLADAKDIGLGTVPSWLGDWRTADDAADRAIQAALDALRSAGENFEGAVFAELDGALPDGAIVWAGSSMPVRDLDTFLPSTDTPFRCLANRGANGIDGVLSSALGAAVAEVGPVLLVVGDVSFLHDLNALATAHVPGVSLTVVLVDNDGGGIFSFLPQATTQRPEVGLPDRFESLLGTPHGTDLPAAARALGALVTELQPGRVGAAVAEGIGRPGISVLHLRTDRARNVELHRQILDGAMGAIG